MTIQLPPLPEWAYYDDLGGVVPSDVRVALRTAQREAALMALEEAERICTDKMGKRLADGFIREGTTARALAKEIRALRAELENTK